MNAPKFTAGPWKLDAEDQRYIRSVKTREYIACRQSSNPADGPLLRAAPELYEALVAMLDNACAASEILDNGTHRIDCTQDEWDGHVKACELARAALAKAVP